MLAQADKERTAHSLELTQLHSRHATALERLRSELQERSAELAASQEECDHLRRKELDSGKQTALEKLDLRKRITELECENDRLKAVLIQQSQRSEAEKEVFEFSTSLRKSQELEDFKKRLAMSGGSFGSQPYSARGVAPDSARSPSMPNTARGASPRASVPGMEPTHLSVNSPLSPMRESVIPPYRAASTMSTPRTGSVGREASPSVLSSLRSPSETYLRLQNISSSWKDRLAQS